MAKLLKDLFKPVETMYQYDCGPYKVTIKYRRSHTSEDVNNVLYTLKDLGEQGAPLTAIKRQVGHKHDCYVSVTLDKFMI